jgi:hypothetical protein
MSNIFPDFLEQTRKNMREFKLLAEKAVAQLDDSMLFVEQNEDANSIAIIMQHLAGNMLSLWTDFLTTDGEKDSRDRDSEFIHTTKDREIVLDKWEKGWTCFLSALDSITPEILGAPILFRKKPLMLFEAVYRQTLHYSYHIGQIVLIAKTLKGAEWQSLSIPKRKAN